MLVIYLSRHSAYQNFVTKNLRKYSPNPNEFSYSILDRTKHSGNLNLFYLVELISDKHTLVS